ncbi:hypothetical protein KBD34_02060 [Patescibacteria group bacterium]|nr:hypothetical protein [Patescibacteria group bacterium]
MNQRHPYPFTQLRYGALLAKLLAEMTDAKKDGAEAEEFPDGIGSIQLSWRASGFDAGLPITARFSDYKRFGPNCTVAIYSEHDAQTPSDGFLRVTLTLVGVDFSPAATP